MYLILSGVFREAGNLVILNYRRRTTMKKTTMITH